VIAQVASAPVVANAGHHYVLLIDPITGDTFDQDEVDAKGGPVNFSFLGVPAGQYELTAGTDLNNDGFICDEGEACAEYPVFGESTPIVVSGTNLSGLNMLTSYRSNADAGTTATSSQTTTSVKRHRRLN
jgi:serine protease